MQISRFQPCVTHIMAFFHGECFKITSSWDCNEMAMFENLKTNKQKKKQPWIYFHLWTKWLSKKVWITGYSSISMMVKSWCQFGISVSTWFKSFSSSLCVSISQMLQLPIDVQTHFLPHCSATQIVIYHLQVTCTWVLQNKQHDLSAYNISWYLVLRSI